MPLNNLTPLLTLLRITNNSQIYPKRLQMPFRMTFFTHAQMGLSA